MLDYFGHFFQNAIWFKVDIHARHMYVKGQRVSSSWRTLTVMGKVKELSKYLWEKVTEVYRAGKRKEKVSKQLRLILNKPLMHDKMSIYCKTIKTIVCSCNTAIDRGVITILIWFYMLRSSTLDQQRLQGTYWISLNTVHIPSKL